MSAVILNDEIVHYEVLGRGRPILFLHGWVGSWRYWIPAMQAASTAYRAYALDLWGFGDTAKNPSSYTLLNQVQLLDDFLQAMGIGKIALIGHGLGSVIGLLFAQRFPYLVDRLLAVAVPNGTQTINPRLASASPVELSDWLLSRNSGSEAVRVEAPKVDPLAVQISLGEILNADLFHLAWALETPSLLVYGQNDPAIIPAETDELTLPGHIHQMIFEQSGHFPMLEEGSKFNRLMADFLALPSGGSPQQLQLKDEWRRRVR